MRKPFRKSLLSLAIAHALGIGIGWPATALATDTQQPSAAAFAPNRDLQQELIELKNAVLARPDDADLRYRLGITYLRAGDGAAAEKELLRARDLGRDDFDLLTKLAEAWLAQGKYQDVIIDPGLKQALGTDDEPAVQALYGRAELGRGSPTPAREAFERALALKPDHPAALLGLGRVELTESHLGAVELLLARLEQAEHPDLAMTNELRGDLEMARGNFERAEAAYRAGLAAAPGRTDLLRDAAFAMLSRGELAEADAELTKVLRMAPNDGNASMMLAMAAFEQDDYERARRLAEGFASAPEGPPLPLYIAGASAYFLGDVEQAREYLSRYVAREPEDAAGRRVYAATLIKLKQGAEAYDLLEPLAAGAEGDIGLLQLLGTAASMAGDTTGGVGYLEKALSAAPDDKRIEIELVMARLTAGDREQGLADLQRLAQDPDVTGAREALLEERLRYGEYDQALALLDEVDADAGAAGAQSEVMRAKALLGQGQRQEAQAVLERILQNEPAHYQASVLMVELLLSRGEAQAALGHAERVAAAYPGELGPQIMLALAERAAKRDDAATQRLNALLRQHPDSVALAATLADIYLGQQQWDKAKDVLDNAPNQESPHILLAYGRYWLDVGNPGEAVATLRHAVERAPADVRTRLLLAKALRETGDRDAATQEIENLAEIAPADPGVRRERTLLAITDLAATPERLEQAVNEIAAMQQNVSPTGVELSGYLALRQGATGRGLELLRQAHEASRTTDTLLTYADSLWAVGQRPAAVEALDFWIEVRPRDARALIRRGAYRLAMADFAAAASDLELARSLGTQGAHVDPMLAYALVMSGNVDAAAPIAEQAYRLAPEDTTAMQAMGLVRLKQGDARGASETLKAAIEASAPLPPAAGLRLDYAEALLAVGDSAAARALLDTLDAELDEDSPLAERLRRLRPR
jgi:putative PEP-CTERM system TPR-repeat lipoprotein